jgi:hypothetical protein
LVRFEKMYWQGIFSSPSHHGLGVGNPLRGVFCFLFHH